MNQGLAVAPAPPLPADWRIARLSSLMGQDWLDGEWDPERLLVLPRPGGQLTRVLRCVVAECPSDRYGSNPLCARHRRQFASSTIPDLNAWLASGEPAVLERHHCCDQRCAVAGIDGHSCPRPAQGPWRLCPVHLDAWNRRRARGFNFQDFCTQARALSDLGPCVARCCYLGAAHPETRLCDIHFQAWRHDGHPSGQRFVIWAERVRQPTNSRVLSLRGLPPLVWRELLYAIGLRAAEQVSVVTGGMRPWVDQLRAAGVSTVCEFDLALLEGIGDAHHVRFARFSVDRVRLAYANVEDERRLDTWDLRLFGRPGRRHLDFRAIRQSWLREAAKAWASLTVGRVSDGVLQHRIGSVALLSAVLAAGPGGGQDPAMLGRIDIERFLVRVHSPEFPVRGRPFGVKARAAAIEEPTGRALPPQVVAQLDAHTDLLADVPGCSGTARIATLGALGEQAGNVAVLAYQLLKGTGRRVGEVVSLHLDCLDVDEHGKDVLVYDNHKAGRMGRRLPIADSGLIAAIRAQQAWVTSRFVNTPRERLWLLPRPHKNADGTNHFSAHQLLTWMRSWVECIPRIDAGSLDEQGEPVAFNRRAIHPHSFRHTYAQTLADSGVAPSVLRDLMDHQSLSTTLGYYRVGEVRKRAAMDLLARLTIDNRGVARTVEGEGSPVGRMREQLSWVAVPMGKCSEPTNVRAGGGACPIRYQCAGCPHFESDPSYLPELRSYADGLRRQREGMLAVGAADWVIQGATRQIEVITQHIHTHEQALLRLPEDQRTVIDQASATLRKARQALPVAFGRPEEPNHG